MSGLNRESVLSVHYWTDPFFSFTTTRNPTFRFRSGEFAMIGFEVGERLLLRAYSQSGKAISVSAIHGKAAGTSEGSLSSAA